MTVLQVLTKIKKSKNETMLLKTTIVVRSALCHFILQDGTINLKANI